MGLSFRPTSQRAQANLASDRHCLQKPSFGSGVLLQYAHLLEASASEPVGITDGCGWRHWLHKRSMPRHTIANQASGYHKLVLVKSRNGLTNPLADHGFKHATQDTALTVHRPFSLHGRGIAVVDLSNALTLACAMLSLTKATAPCP